MTIWITRAKNRTAKSPIHTREDCPHITEQMIEYPDSQLDELDRRICNYCSGNGPAYGARSRDQQSWKHYRAAVAAGKEHEQ